MQIPAFGPRVALLAAFASLTACAADVDPDVTAPADERQRVREAPAEAPIRPGDESLAALTAEVRQLRLAVEELARSQSETQALGVSLSAQQTRLQEADERLAVARREIDSATAAREDIEARLTDLQAEQARESSPERRAELEDALKGYRMEQTRLDRDLQQARSRENDLSRALKSEETRWNDLMARLENLAR